MKAWQMLVCKERTIAVGSPRGPWRVTVEGSRVMVNSIVETGRARGFEWLAGGAVEEEEVVVVGAEGAGTETASASRACW